MELYDISTAPKDGTPILVYYANSYGMRKWSIRYWSRGDWKIDGKSVSAGWSDEYRQLRKEQPTHWAMLSDISATAQDTRPANCRYRLQDEGKPYPRSSCAVAGCRGVFGALCK